MNHDESLPLSGIRVIEMGDAWAGPYTATLLADLGAESIRVETVRRRPAIVRGTPLDAKPHPLYPDADPGDMPTERHIFLHAVDHNKRSITLDLKDDRGQDLIHQLFAISDIFVFNFTPAALGRLGLEPHELAGRHPHLVIASILGFGLDSPYPDYVSVGSTTDGFCGHSALRGYPDSAPLDNTGLLYTDSVAACTATFAIQAALRQRQSTGAGQLIDLSQAEATTAHFAHAITDYTWNDRLAGATANDHRTAAPHNTYPCASVPKASNLSVSSSSEPHLRTATAAAPNATVQPGDEKWIAIACFTDDHWHALTHVIDDPTLTTNPHYRTALKRWKHRHDLDAHLDAWTENQDAHQLAAQLQAAGVPAQALMTAADIAADPHIAARGFLKTMDHPHIGERLHTQPFFSFNGRRAPLHRPASLLGQDNAYVLQDLLGLDATEYANLEANGIIGTRFRS